MYVTKGTEHKLITLGFPVKMGEELYILPTHSEVKKWLREEKGIHVNPRHSTFKQLYGYKITTGYSSENDGIVKQDLAAFKTYEQAESEAIKEAVEYLKSQL